MIKTRLMDIGGRPLHVCECLSPEEAQKEGLPAGINYYWDLGGRKIHLPLEMIAVLQKAGETDPDFFRQVTGMNPAEHHKAVLEHQRGVVLEHLTKSREMIAEHNGDPELKKVQLNQLDSAIAAYSKIGIDTGSNPGFNPNGPDEEAMLNRMNGE